MGRAVLLDNAVRVDKRDEVMATLTAADFAGCKRDELLAMLDAADVPVGPVNDVAEILTDPHVARARAGRQLRLSRASANSRRSRCPYKFLGWDDPQIGRPPTLGEHTESVLAELLGFAEQIAKLRAAKAI